MRAITVTPLQELREKEEQLKAKEKQVQQLGIALTEEKIKNAQMETMVSHLGQEFAQMKIEILRMKGAAGE